MKHDLKSIVQTVLLNFIFILATCYILFQLFRNTGNAVETERAEFLQRQDKIEVNGYIFRNEEVIFSPGGNRVNYLTESGEKVAKNQAVAQININSYDLSLQAQIEDLDKKIDILENSNINLSYVKTTLDKLESDSNAMYLNIMHSLQSGKVKNAVKDRNTLLIILNKKQLMTQEMTKDRFDNLIESLKERRDQLEAQMSLSSGGNIYSNKSGIFYTKTDGYENLFTADEIKSLDLEKFHEYINMEPDINILNNSVGKVAYDYNWYLVCIAPKKKDIEYVEGEPYNIIYPFSSNKALRSTLTKKIESVNSDEILLIFDTMLMPDGFDFSRKQVISVVFYEANGIKIPEQAVRIVTNDKGIEEKGVYTLKRNTVIFKELPEDEYIGKYDGYYVYLDPSLRTANNTGTLQLHEDIIVAGKDLYDGKILD